MASIRSVILLISGADKKFIPLAEVRLGNSLMPDARCVEVPQSPFASALDPNPNRTNASFSARVGYDGSDYGDSAAI